MQTVVQCPLLPYALIQRHLKLIPGKELINEFSITIAQLYLFSNSI